MKVKPRPGIILAGIPASGADVPAKLAQEWIRNGLVVSLEPQEPPKRKRGRPRKVRE